MKQSKIRGRKLMLEGYLDKLLNQQGKLTDSVMIRHKINVALDVTEKCLKYKKKPEDVIKILKEVVEIQEATK